MWGEELTCPEDVCHVFECYITGEKNKNGVKVCVCVCGGGGGGGGNNGHIGTRNFVLYLFWRLV